MNSENKNALNRNLKYWTLKYSSANPHLWGLAASPTAQYLLETREFDHLVRQKDTLNFLEIGAGYGRDTNLFTQLGHHVVAFEMTSNGFGSAPPSLKHCGSSQLNWISEDFINYPDIKDEDFDVAFSHRTLHLLTEQSLVDQFKSKLSRVVKKGGIICLSARDIRDFNPDQMAWIDQENFLAKYTLPQRKDHIISFWSAERFEKEFGNMLEIVTLIPGEEPESISNADKSSHFTIMIGIR